MASDRYITPAEFRKCVNEGSLIRLAFGIRTNEEMSYGKRMVDSLREINRKDPGFRYSCECGINLTTWLFGYTDQTVFDEADKLTDQIIIEARKEMGIYDADEPTADVILGPRAPCTCPFNPSGV